MKSSVIAILMAILLLCSGVATAQPVGPQQVKDHSYTAWAYTRNDTGCVATSISYALTTYTNDRTKSPMRVSVSIWTSSYNICTGTEIGWAYAEGEVLATQYSVAGDLSTASHFGTLTGVQKVSPTAAEIPATFAVSLSLTAVSNVAATTNRGVNDYENECSRMHSVTNYVGRHATGQLSVMIDGRETVAQTVVNGRIEKFDSVSLTKNTETACYPGGDKG